MYDVKKTGKVFTSKFVGTGPSSDKKRIYRAAVSQRLRNTALEYQPPIKPQAFQEIIYFKLFGKIIL